MNIVLMCGGLSKRFVNDKSEHVCKLTYLVNGKPMIIHILDTIQKLNENYKIIIVLSLHYANDIRECINNHIDNLNNIFYSYQDMTRPGTAGAIHSCLSLLNDNNQTLILSGDVPFITLDSLENLMDYKNCMIITRLETPTGNGRIIFGRNDETVVDIIEQVMCDESQAYIKFVNTGNYYLETSKLLELIPLIGNNNRANEYYLTDIVKLLDQHSVNLNYYELPREQQYQIHNINTLQDLYNAEELYYQNNVPILQDSLDLILQ